MQPNISNTGSHQLNIGNWIYGSGGNIGIGATNPYAKFEIQSNVPIPFGSELITNGDFTGSSTGWTLGDCATYGSNEVTVLFTSCTDPTISTTFETIAGTTYTMTFDVVGNGDQV